MTANSETPVDAPLMMARRLVVKTGSALVVDPASGVLRTAWLESLADDIAELRRQGVEVVVVASGAVALGRQRLGLTPAALGRRPRLTEKQAAAAAGQVRLAQAYETALGRHAIPSAQVLLTPSDTEERRAHLNARDTLTTLLRLGAVPVVNENDTVATVELRFGDNDRLAARVAQMISADTLVLLSDIDGLYTADPRHNPAAQHLPIIRHINAEIEAMAGLPPPGYSSGGMVTKLAAARIATQAGCRMVIARGQGQHPLAALENASERRTWFCPLEHPLSARKKWIAGHVTSAGSVIIDDGAVAALAAGRSLLPAGITAVSGSFDQGDVISVLGSGGALIARGLSGYAASDLAQIIGCQTSEIANILGFDGREEIIHRDDLVIG